MANSLMKILKNNRVVMIISALLIMTVAVSLIENLQRKTLEQFAVYSAAEGGGYATNEANVLTTAQHGTRHATCNHTEDSSTVNSCKHVHETTS